MLCSLPIKCSLGKDSLWCEDSLPFFIHSIRVLLSCFITALWRGARILSTCRSFLSLWNFTVKVMDYLTFKGKLHHLINPLKNLIATLRPWTNTSNSDKCKGELITGLESTKSWACFPISCSNSGWNFTCIKIQKLGQKIVSLHIYM